MDSHKHPAIVITGASTGIGEAAALELDHRGYHVFAGVRTAEAANRLQAQATGLLTPLLLDVTDAAQIAAAAEKVRERTGERGLAGLINNAGIAISGPLEITPLAEFRRQLEVNVVGQLAMIQTFIPQLRLCKGRIVNISSVNGAFSPPYLGPYSASKFAFEAISDALRIELRQWGIRVIVIAPGAIKTPIWDKSTETAEKIAADISAENMKLYENDLNLWRDAVAKVAQASEPVEMVVEKIVHALTSPHPRARYYLRFSQRYICRGLKVLPESMRDWFVCRALGFQQPSNPSQ
jgi:NAD(P)-dependent dehydrogenase (short-subunit alcohol dehydrogenase family)